jgi:hypothetical protein
MDLPKDRPTNHLPRRFPVGAKYVVEGYSGEEGNLRVVARYVLLPGGRRIDVLADLSGQASGRALPFRRRSPRKRSEAKSQSGSLGKKLAARSGTGSRQAR